MPLKEVFSQQLEDMVKKMAAQTQMGKDLVAEKTNAIKVEIDDLTAKIEKIQTKIHEMRKKNVEVVAKIRVKQQEVGDAEGSGSSHSNKCAQVGREHHDANTLIAKLSMSQEKVRTDYQKLLSNAKGNINQANAMRRLFAMRSKAVDMGRIFAEAPFLPDESVEGKKSAFGANATNAGNLTNSRWAAKVRARHDCMCKDIIGGEVGRVEGDENKMDGG
jgi:hypothetical protein